MPEVSSASASAIVQAVFGATMPVVGTLSLWPCDAWQEGLRSLQVSTGRHGNGPGFESKLSNSYQCWVRRDVALGDDIHLTKSCARIGLL